MSVHWRDILVLTTVAGGVFACLAPIHADERRSPRDGAPASGSEYLTADIVVRDLQEFRVADAETVAELASHFPGILEDRGSGPRKSAGKRATLTIRFNHISGDVGRLRVAHVAPDYSTWWWRDNTPYTGDRQVEGKDQLERLIKRLAAEHEVEPK